MTPDAMAELCLWVMAGMGALIFALVALGLVNEVGSWLRCQAASRELSAWLAQKRRSR